MFFRFEYSSTQRENIIKIVLHLLGSNTFQDPYPRQDNALLISISPGGLFGFCNGWTVAQISMVGEGRVF